MTRAGVQRMSSVCSNCVGGTSFNGADTLPILELSHERRTTLNVPTARVHDEHDDSMDTTKILVEIHRDLRVIVGIV